MACAKYRGQEEIQNEVQHMRVGKSEAPLPAPDPEVVGADAETPPPTPPPINNDDDDNGKDVDNESVISHLSGNSVVSLSTTEPMSDFTDDTQLLEDMYITDMLEEVSAEYNYRED